MKLSQLFNSLPKRLLVIAILATAFAFPAATFAAEQVNIEAQTGIANVTAGDTDYSAAINASYDQIVKVQITYDNDEDAGSGKVANNLRVKINIPTQAGKNQTITTTTSADNSNTVNGSVTATLDSANSYLQYIPKSAVWKHADGQTGQVVEQSVSDDVALNGNGLVLENENPCQAGSVTVLARVMTPGVKIVKEVENASQNNAYATTNTANPGDTLKYRITYQNTGNTVQNQVIIRDNLPAGMTLVPGTTYIFDAATSSKWVKVSDEVVNGGINLGDFGAGANAYVSFQVKLQAADQMSCGDTVFRNVGVAHPQGMQEYYNIATTTVSKACATAPTCTSVTVTPGSNRSVSALLAGYNANGATLKSVTYDFGDGSTPYTTNNFTTAAQHTYAKDGSYNVTAKLLFSVNGVDTTVTGANCSKPVSYTTAAPTTLANTGPGDTIAWFAGATIAGAIAHRLFLSRRLSRRS